MLNEAIKEFVEAENNLTVAYDERTLAGIEAAYKRLDVAQRLLCAEVARAHGYKCQHGKWVKPEE